MKKVFFVILFGLSLYVFAQKEDSLYNITEKLSPVILSQTTDILKHKQDLVANFDLKSSFIKQEGNHKDIPEYLNNLPSVYVFNAGGVGDSQILLRGFNQRNIAVLINGVPVNDMETGWVYWSNWNHLPEITSVIQLQQGLGASKLSVPSVGGTINIVTKPSFQYSGGSMSFQYLSTAMYQQALAYHTGLLSNGLSVSFRFGHAKGKEYVDMTQSEGYDYYFNAIYQPNSSHTIMFNLIGAPQWHNQRNIAPTLSAYLRYGVKNQPNIKYNSEWGIFKEKPYTWSRNFFHKPLLSFNWDWKINNCLKFGNIWYAAWGRGGGTGPVGAVNYHYPGDEVFINNNGQVRFDDIYDWNRGLEVKDFGTVRQQNRDGLYVNQINEGLTRYAFMNNHSWYGSVLNLSYQLNPKMQINTGLDARWTFGKNTLTVNDVLGADAYYDYFNRNHPNHLIFSEDFVPATFDWNPLKSIDNLEKIIFYNQSNIRWLGAFLQQKYNYHKWNFFFQMGGSFQFFQKIDYFNFSKEQARSSWVKLNGGNLKTGVGYKLDTKNFTYVNAGYFSKQPLFKAVFSNENSLVPQANLFNEKIYTSEVGYKFLTPYLKFYLNAYYTTWKNRYQQVKDLVQNQQVTGVLKGIEEIHKGLELVAKLKFDSWYIENMFSLGDWYYKGNVTGVVLYNNQHQALTIKNYYLNGIKVGDAAQFTSKFRLGYKLNYNFEIWASQFYADKLYARIDAGSFSNYLHKGSLRLPAYSVIDVGAKYKLKIKNFSAVLYAGVQNLMDKKYITQSQTNFFATKNSVKWNGIDVQNRVFFGKGRTYSLSLNVDF